MQEIHLVRNAMKNAKKNAMDAVFIKQVLALKQHLFVVSLLLACLAIKWNKELIMYNKFCIYVIFNLGFTTYSIW